MNLVAKIILPVIIIILPIIVLGMYVVIIGANLNKSDEERKFEDEEQMKYLRENNK